MSSAKCLQLRHSQHFLLDALPAAALAVYYGLVLALRYAELHYLVALLPLSCCYRWGQ